MNLQFSPATKEKSKLRLAIFGPSGAGKTYTALSLSGGLKGKIALIDTERGSASKYADRFNFDVLELPDRTIDVYVQAIQAAAQAEYGVLIIDSLTHAWKELLDEVEKIARAKYKGNTWSAWSEGTPKQMKLVDAILDYPGHIIVTMRSKTEWSVESTANGKTRPVRVGLAPEQGKGIEYEFDILMELSTDHVASIIKDRTGRFQDKVIEKPDKKLGQEILSWLDEGAEPRIIHWSESPDKQAGIEKNVAKLGAAMEDFFTFHNLADWEAFKRYEGEPQDAWQAFKEYYQKQPEPA